MIEHQKHEGFAAANEELRGFLRRVDSIADNMGSVASRELWSSSRRLLNLDPEVGDAARGKTLDADLQIEIAEYVKNLRALQTVLAKVQCIVVARNLQQKSGRRRSERLHDFIND
jgi:hypothetical protein